MEINIKTLEKHDACKDGLDWLKEQGTLDLCEVVKRAIKQGGVTMGYANWGITRSMNHKQQVQYAVFAALQVLKIYEDKYPDDKRPRRAIEAAEAYVDNPTEASRQAAWAAAWAAGAAAWAAGAAEQNRIKAKILRYGVKLLMEDKKV